MKYWTLFLLSLFFLCAGSASAALPPVDDAERQERSDRIVRGEIRAIYTRKRKKRDDFVDLELVLEVLVKESLKGGSAEGETIYIHCWTVEKRPERWVGDGGQRPLPGEGDTGVFFMEESGSGVFRLLEPNGWDRD